jgi:hypothetical protein
MKTIAKFQHPLETEMWEQTINLIFLCIFLIVLEASFPVQNKKTTGLHKE